MHGLVPRVRRPRQGCRPRGHGEVLWRHWCGTGECEFLLPIPDLPGPVLSISGSRYRLLSVIRSLVSRELKLKKLPTAVRSRHPSSLFPCVLLTEPLAQVDRLFASTSLNALLSDSCPRLGLQSCPKCQYESLRKLFSSALSLFEGSLSLLKLLSGTKPRVWIQVQSGRTLRFQDSWSQWTY